eukprot:ANDGO_01394.mRNA.1 Osmotic avoidance abnormal protein 3
MGDVRSNITVIARCRPLIAAETAETAENEGSDRLLKALLPDRSVLLFDRTDSGPRFCRRFVFDNVFTDESTQDNIFSGCVSPLIRRALEGFNATVFAYGQTGSGKTYTMEGYAYTNARSKPKIDIESTVPEQLGIVPRAITFLFDEIENLRSENSGTEVSLSCSFLQIYNERVYDLLSDFSAAEPVDKQPILKVRWAPGDTFFVEGLTNQPVGSSASMAMWYHRGLRQRATASHSLNANSSRSHSIFQIYISRTEKKSADADLTGRQSALSFVDLAGSEKLSVISDNPQDSLRREHADINQSLFALGKVISSLYRTNHADKGRKRGDRQRKSALHTSPVSRLHIPYRDSVLTKLLKESLGGNSLTVMIACLSPLDSHYHENLSTLLYAARTRAIRNVPKINDSRHSSVVHSLQQEIVHLKSEIEELRQAVQVSNALADVSPSRIVVGNDALLSNSSLTFDHVKSQISDSVNLIKALLSRNQELSSTIAQLQEENASLSAINTELMLENDQLRNMDSDDISSKIFPRSSSEDSAIPSLDAAPASLTSDESYITHDGDLFTGMFVENDLPPRTEDLPSKTCLQQPPKIADDPSSAAQLDDPVRATFAFNSLAPFDIRRRDPNRTSVIEDTRRILYSEGSNNPKPKAAVRATSSDRKVDESPRVLEHPLYPGAFVSIPSSSSVRPSFS